MKPRKLYAKKSYQKNRKKIDLKRDLVNKVGRKSLNALAEITSTEMALAFGRSIKNNPHAIAGIKDAQEYWHNQLKFARSDERRIYFATRCNFCREAIQEATK